MSFIDVDSLSTNMPLHEIVDYLCDSSSSSDISLPIPVDYLRPWNHHYRQIDDAATGDSWGPTLAAVFLFMIETKLNDRISRMILHIWFVEDIIYFCQLYKFFKYFEPRYFRLTQYSSFLWTKG